MKYQQHREAKTASKSNKVKLMVVVLKLARNIEIIK